MLVAAGRIVSGVNYFHDFERFHLYISPSTLYYPTASQVVTLTKSLVAPDQVAVIVGGSSVMWGAGQADFELWTQHLQEDLGPRYRVVNLSLPSGSPEEHGAVAAEALLKEGYKVIFLSDLGNGFGSPDGLFYPYVYWDAYYKGLLLPNEQALPVIETAAKTRTSAPPLEELKSRAMLDSAFYFADFWNAFSYNVLFTTWNYLVAPPNGWFYMPRTDFKDPQPQFPDDQRYSNPSRDQAMSIVRAYVTLECPTDSPGPTSHAAADAYWSNWNTTASVAFPQDFRRNMLVVRVFQARLYRDALTPAEVSCYGQEFAETTSRLSALGYNATEIGADWTPEDYIDVTHPAAAGGVKMAATLAPEIQELARRLGYVE